ncbi:MAG: FtsX-like permease family protein [Spirochaetaceae bacterium]|jgi:ABC-type lipoprotein release transport system permease subunit|nr:FtsX-like permease family protein [Spirochaetaceae bacterium]
MRAAEAFKLSLKYLIRHRKRYFFLFCALSFGFCAVTVIMSIKDGMERNVFLSAQSHYSGDVVVMGRDAESEISGHISNEYIQIINSAVLRSKKTPVKQIMRTQYFGDANLFHDGENVTAKYILGVDWEAEADYINALSYDSRIDFEVKNSKLKKAPPLKLTEESILLSQPLAEKINARAGDKIILEVENAAGQMDTAYFVAAGVFKDNSIFGFYKCFTSRARLNALSGFKPDECSVIGLYFTGEKEAEEARADLQKNLEGKLQISGYTRNRAEWRGELAKNWDGIMIFLLSLPVFLTEVTDILSSINLISFILYIMMLMIIFVSAAVTYRLIFHERIKEIGAMRAIGFSSGAIVAVLALETAFLSIVSIASGFILALIVNKCFSFVSFSWIPGLDTFLEGGRLSVVYKTKIVLLNASAVFVMLSLAVLPPAFRLSRSPLALMLTGASKE